MRIQIFIISLIVLTHNNTKCQNLCANGRFSTEVYSTFTTTNNIVYGTNKTYNGTIQDLTLDFYEPVSDTAIVRPLIIWAHGGSFVTGTKNDPDIVTLCQKFVKRGFVCASINYRIGSASYDSISAVKAVIRAIQDMKSSIRFFYKDQQTINQFKVDTNNIFIGGSSAGAITALSIAYLDKSCEIIPYISQTELDTLGGLTGNSGNPCYSSKVKGVINLSGGIVRYGWIETGDVPFCSMHGTNDGIVPYNRGKLNPGIPLIFCDGSRMIYERATNIGIANNFYTWHGAGHMPFNGTNATAIAYMDTTIKFVRDYLINRLSCPDNALIAPNIPYSTSSLYSYTACFSDNTNNYCPSNTTNVKENINLDEEFDVNVYPNPSNGGITLIIKDSNPSTYQISLTNIFGITKRYEKVFTNDAQLKIEEIQGLYILKVTNSIGQSKSLKIVFQ